ncbi:hypothetical protein GQ600_9243 [Phytophthora cactorum]|nr:hypothetical protein GQ600_9243 [Phytophthora cactorum]
MAPQSKRSLADTLNVSTSEPELAQHDRRFEAGSVQAGPQQPTNFKAIWRALRNEGWYSKPPPRNSHDSFYRYIRGGSSLKGQEGTNFFVGEQALMAYYLQKSLLAQVTIRQYYAITKLISWNT